MHLGHTFFIWQLPFAFGFPAELATDAERALAAAMGCAWRNFIWTSDPATPPPTGACAGGAAAPAWPRFCSGGACGNATQEGALAMAVKTMEAK